MTALVITQRQDTTADFVIVALGEMGMPVFPIDFADLPDYANITATHHGGTWTGHLHVGPRAVALDEITGIYGRRPTNPQVDGPGQGVAAGPGATRRHRPEVTGRLRFRRAGRSRVPTPRTGAPARSK